jgi:hypothetical protein
MPDERITAPQTNLADPKPIRFSLRTLFLIVTLISIVCAGFAWNPFAGIFVYLGCFTLIASYYRGLAACRRYDAICAARGDPGTATGVIVGAGILVALAGAIAFCGTCSFAQAPFFALHASPDKVGDTEEMFVRGLLVSMPLGTFAAILVYTLTWPPTFRRVPRR